MSAEKKSPNQAKRKSKKPVVLLDTHALLYRSYHALPDFRTPSGEPTGALYGLSLMLLSVLEELQPAQVIACYDLPKPTHRHEAFADYKAGRKPVDEELITQIKSSRQIFEAFSIPVRSLAGYEADDLLGTFSRQLAADGHDVIIASGDMDTLQLVEGKKVQVYTLKKGIKETTLYDEQAVIDRYGFGPDFVVDYKGLRGDPSDNIPGVKGVGDKTATSLISAFGHLDEIYQAVDKGEDFLIGKGFTKRVYKLLSEGREEAQFSKMLATIHCNVDTEPIEVVEDWFENIDFKPAEELFTRLSFRTLVARLPHKKASAAEAADDVEAQALKEPTLTDAQTKELGIALWLLDPIQTEATAKEIFSYTKTDTYAFAKIVLLEKLESADLMEVYTDIELPLIPILAAAKKYGVLIDTDYLKELQKEYKKEIVTLEKNIHKIADTDFNPASSQQLAEVLFEKLNIKKTGIKKTSTGRLSTAESELQKIVNEHPIVPQIMRHRALGKLLNTYVTGLLESADKVSRIHSTLVQNGTTTGRFASKDPNLQNIPIKNEEGRRIRRAFTAPEGSKLLALDYSQVELRIAAILSGDKDLTKIFAAGRDIHTETAARIFEVTPEAVESDQRRKAKTINFAILYGMGVNALRQSLGDDTTRAEAGFYLDQYFKTFSGLAQWIEELKSKTKKTGYTETLFGRKRYFPEIKSNVPFIRTHAERAAVNAPIQGTQADMIKLAMIQCENKLAKEGLSDQAHLVLQIHDELVYEVKDSVSETVGAIVQETMQSILPDAVRGEVPIITGYAVGSRLGELVEKQQ